MGKVYDGSKLFGTKTYYANRFNSGLELKTKVKVIRIIKKSSSRFWKDLQPGDTFDIVFLMKIGNSTAAEVDVRINDVVVTKGKATNISKHMSNLEFEVLE